MRITKRLALVSTLAAVSCSHAGPEDEEQIHWLPLRTGAKADRAEVYKTVAGQKLSLQLFFPPGHDAKTDNRPAILVIHGGGWTSPGAKRWAPFCRYFARRGMVAVSIEYRLASREKSIRMKDCLADSRAAFEYVHGNAKKLGIDPERIVLAGESAGGQLAAGVAMIPSKNEHGGERKLPDVDAMVLYNPCLDLTALHWMKKHAAISPTPETPENETWKDRAKALSPINYITPNLPPAMILHGEKDEVVPIEQIDRFVEAARKAGNKVEYHRMSEWGHAFAVAGYADDDTVVETIRITDKSLAQMGYLEGEPLIAMGRRQPEDEEQP
ncbi:MAG: alpha/beta hydrolase [bacterium]